MKRDRALNFLLCSFAVALCCVSCSYATRSAEDMQRDYAREITPADFSAVQRPPDATVKDVVRLRVYAVVEYQSKNLRWKAKFSQTVARANLLLAALGVRFEVVEFADWEFSDDGKLETALRDLEALDPSDSVERVVGLMPSLPVFSASTHQLGMARVLGRHIVLRGVNDLAEREHLMTELNRIPEEEREALFKARRDHKAASVLLHEWGHTLGALHTQDSAWLMSSFYDHGQAAFCPDNLALLKLGIAHRMPVLDERQDERTRVWTKSILEHIRARSAGGCWEDESRETMLTILDNDPQSVGLVLPLTGTEIQRYNQTLGLVQMGASDTAWKKLGPLLEARPDHPDVLSLACTVASSEGFDDAVRAEAFCETAAEKAPRDPYPLLRLAHLRLDKKEPASARAAIFGAWGRCKAKEKVSEGLWLYLAQLAHASSMPTVAEDAAARHPADPRTDKVLAWARETRHITGLTKDPEQSAVPIEEEGAYIQAYEAVYTAIYEKGGDRRKLRELQAGFEATYPRAAGPPSLRCAALLRQSKRRDARKACEQALEKSEASSTAHFFLAVLDGHQRSAEAIAHLHRAIELEPRHRSAWKMLGKLLERHGDKEALGALKKRYEAQFGEPL